MPTVRCNIPMYVEGFINEPFVDGFFPQKPLEKDGNVSEIDNGTFRDTNEYDMKMRKNEYIDTRNTVTDHIKKYSDIVILNGTTPDEIAAQTELSNGDNEQIQDQIDTLLKQKVEVRELTTSREKSIKENNDNLEMNRINSNQLQKERERIEKDTYTFHKIISNGRQKLLFGRNISIILIIINIFLLVYLFYSIKNIN